MKNNSFIYLCLFEILTVYIMHVNSSQYESKRYIIPKSNTKYISTHNIRHKHHYMNRTLATSKKPTNKHNPTPKVHSQLLTTTKKPTFGAKSVKPIIKVSPKHPLNDATLKKPTEFHFKEVTTKPPVYKEDSYKPLDTTIDLLALTLKDKLLNNEDRSKLNDLSNNNNLAPPTFDFTTKPFLTAHDHHAGRSLPYFDQYLQKDSPHLMQPAINMSSDGSIQKINDFMLKTDRFVNENSDHIDDDEDNDDDEDEDIGDDDDDEDEEDAIAMFDDELSSSTLTSTSTTTTMSTTIDRSGQVSSSYSTVPLTVPFAPQKVDSMYSHSQIFRKTLICAHAL